MPRLTVKQAAEYIPLSESTLNHLRVVGGGPVFMKPVPGTVLYDTKDLDAWLKVKRQSSTSENASPRKPKAPASPKPLRRPA